MSKGDISTTVCVSYKSVGYVRLLSSLLYGSASLKVEETTHTVTHTSRLMYFPVGHAQILDKINGFTFEPFFVPDWQRRRWIGDTTQVIIKDTDAHLSSWLRQLTIWPHRETDDTR